jgi:hypothetical protein
MKKIGTICLTFTLLLFGSLHAERAHNWKPTYAKGGDCHIDFPSPPQLVQQSMKVSEAGHQLVYDIYLAPFQNRGVFLLLIATYPGPVHQGNEGVGLEGLVQGIVNHHVDNQLIFANGAELMGRPAIDFLVQSGSNYFRGYALMVGNKLYLIAMEGKKGELDETVFSRFMQSFKLIQ